MKARSAIRRRTFAQYQHDLDTVREKLRVQWTKLASLQLEAIYAVRGDEEYNTAKKALVAASKAVDEAINETINAQFPTVKE